MDTARDLASAALWQQSLERSLARRGKPTRSSLELYRLRPERDLVYGDFVRESGLYSQMRRSASKRPSMVVPGAGGISALALLAAATLPSLLGGRGGAGARHARTAYRTETNAARLRKAHAAAHAAAPQLAASTGAASTAGSLDGVGAMPSPTMRAAAASALHASNHAAIPSSHSSTHGHVPLARAHHISPSRDASGGVVAHTVSGGAAPPSPRISAAVPRVPASPQPSGHPSTGGAAVRERSAISSVHVHTPTARHHPHGAAGPKRHTRASTTTHRRPTSATARPHKPTHLRTVGHAHPLATPKHKPAAPSKPVTAPAPKHKPAVPPRSGAAPVPKPKPAAPSKPIAAPAPKPAAPAKPKPVAKSEPVATTKPAAPPSSSAPPVAAGHYVNPLAGASVTPERIDQGVDYAGSGTLSALGDGKVTYVAMSGTGWPGAFIEYQLTDGPDSGRYVYYAEGVSPVGGLHVGGTVSAGQPVAQITAGSSTGIEIGWGSGVGTQPLAQADGNWSGSSDAHSVASPEGKDFSALIASLGGPPGKIEG